MPSKAAKLLQKMRQSSAGWAAQDLIALYEGFGFEVKHGGSHDTVKHPEFPQVAELRDTIPRGASELAKGYIRDAIKRIELLEKLRREAGGE